MSGPRFPSLNDPAPWLLQQVVEAELAKVHGLAMGLTVEQTGEVVDAYVLHYRTVPASLSWDVVRHALTLRAIGEEWKP